jgi:hypothetical protein
MATVRHIGLFPWCQTKSQTDSGWENSVVVSKSEATLLWWRAKKIGIRDFETVDISVAGISPIFNPFTISPEATTEKGLVCHGTSRVFDQNGTNSGSITNGFANVEAGQNFTLNLAYNANTTGDSDFFLLNWIANTVYTGFGFVRGSNSGTISFLFGTEGTSNPTGTIPVTFSFGSRTLIRPTDDAYVISTSGSNPPSFTFNFLAPNYEILEYWPYDPNDGGGPIYDSITGAQLRAFPAI